MFAKAVLGENVKVFIVHIAFFTLEMIFHPIRKAQITLLLAKKIIVPAQYSDFTDFKMLNLVTNRQS